MRWIAALAALNLVLGATVTWLSLRPRPVTVLPYGELAPNHVPDPAARAFTARYVLLFDNFTPATIDAVTDHLKGLISPRYWTQAAEALEKRRTVVHEGRMGSQVILTDPGEIRRFEDGSLQVAFTATRRTYIADKLTRETKTRYIVAIEPTPPTPVNPHGLYVIGQNIQEETLENP